MLVLQQWVQCRDKLQEDVEWARAKGEVVEEVREQFCGQQVGSSEGKEEGVPSQ